MTASPTGAARNELRTEDLRTQDTTAQVTEQIRRLLANPRRTRR